MADPGSVMFQFSRKGCIMVSEKGEETMMTVLDAGAEDVDETDDGLAILTAPSDLMKVRAALIDAGLTVTDAELKYIPTSTVALSDADSEKLDKLLDSLDDLDDVTAVHTNVE